MVKQVIIKTRFGMALVIPTTYRLPVAVTFLIKRISIRVVIKITTRTLYAVATRSLTAIVQGDLVKTIKVATYSVARTL